MANFEKELLRRLDDYKSRGIIDAQSESNLRRELSGNIARDGGRTGHNALFVVAAILIFTACAVWVQHNWSEFGIRLREFLAFVPLMISAGVGIAAIKKNLGQFWRESAAVLNIAGVAVMIATIGRIYQIQPDELHFYLSVMCLSLVAVPIFRSGAAIAVLACFNFAYTTECSDAEYVAAIVIYVVLTLLACKYLKIGGVFRAGSLLAVCMSAAIAISSRATDSYTPLLLAGFTGLFLATAATRTFAKYTLFNNPFAVGGVLLMLWFATAASSRSFIKDLTGATEECIAFLPTLCTVGALYLYALFRAYKNPHRPLPLLALSAVFVGYALGAVSRNFWVAVAVVNISIFAAAVFTAVRGIFGNDKWYANIGIGLIILQCLARTLDYDIDISIRAGTFAAAGLLLAAFNVYMNRRIRNENAH